MLHAKIHLDAEVEPRRREPRTELSAEISLRELGRTAIDARLINISSRGFMVEAKDLVSPGSRLWLTLPGAGRVNGLVIWTKNGRLGGEFAEPIDPLAVIYAAGEASF